MAEAEKEIALLKEQKSRLEDKKFDLEAWKNYTIIFLERIFGPESSKLKMIKELHYDYSSWSLRDVSGAGKAKDPVKMRAAEILDSTILELEQLGLPEKTKEKEKVWQLLEDELTGKQVKEIKSIIDSEVENKPEKIKDILANIDKEGLISLIAQLLAS
ncbi:MAG: hypothetical protein GXO81_06860 [Chlorobi bacterium]|nr:hypothetical protein [Chlorobiota bacterium]